jgi:NhaP-type Na+/H+ or K+/H+ antiporter
VLAQTWLLVFGGVFLAEELYETGVVALVLRRAARTAS